MLVILQNKSFIKITDFQCHGLSQGNQLFFVPEYLFGDYCNKHLICDKANYLALQWQNKFTHHKQVNTL